MELKMFYRTQRELAVDLNKLVDSYWREEIKENDLIVGIKNLYLHNQEKLIKDNEFTKVVQQQCGKRRLAIVGRVLEFN
ncbi:TIGR04540 family protein [Fredinandcohnia sp. FSL W7-1320]|uniref:TIGR04540 family protein n=1 Tax=Fredinandcohnia sp. FSL W7-1320 TaxID=2954540 RepID=UPI0030FD57C4